MTAGLMSAGLPQILRYRLSEFVAERFGLRFPEARWDDLEHGVRAAAQEYRGGAIEEYVQRLLTSTSSSATVNVLANRLTVGETYFFREKRSFDQLEERILPEFIGKRLANGRQPNIWSAGCATGEEPYSVSILLSRLIPNLKDWNISILATDLNSRSIERAGEGVYGEWSFRSTPAWVRSAYFTPTSDGRWAIVPAVKKMVRFARLNLVGAEPLDFANVFDVVLCRNVLMYFTPEAARKVVDHLYRALAPGGWLIVGSVETSDFLFREFAAADLPGGAIYRKLAGQLDAATNCCPGGSGKPAGLPEPRLAFPRHEASKSVDSETPPPIAESALLLARHLADQRRLPEALGWCDTAIRVDQMDAQSHYLRAEILQEQGLFEEARLSLRRAIYANPEFVLAHFALGHLAMRQRKPKASRKCFENALELLRQYQQEGVLPGSDDLTAGRLSDWVHLGMDQAIAMEAGELAEALVQRSANRDPHEATPA